MKTCFLVLLIGGLMTLPAKAAGLPDRGDMERLQGTWELIAAARDGVRVPKAELKGTKITITGNRFAFSKETGLATSEEGTLRIDASKKPRRLDTTAASGGGKGVTHLGIYKISGDRYKFCYAPPGKERPREFATKAGSGHVLQIWKRVK